MCIYRRTLIVLLLSLFLLFSIGCAQKYAVLISANNVTVDDVAYHSVWWYDLFIKYKMLRENGFEDEKIYVLYGKGADFNTIHGDYNSITQFGHSITDMAVNKANIQSVFNTLNSNVTSDDYLYVWWMGHGGGAGPGLCNLTMEISHIGEHVTDVEFAGYVNSVTKYEDRSVAVMTCHAGGMTDNFNTAGNKTVTLTSSTCVESSYEAPVTCNGMNHAEFNYTLSNALRLQNPCGTAVASDIDSNGYVSLTEAHQYNSATMTTSTPQMVDPDGIAATTYIKMIDP